MRAFNLILITAMASLWGYFAVEVAPRDSSSPVRVESDGDELSAATLNNEGVRLDRSGQRGDALAYFDRAHDFRPRDGIIATNVSRAEARLAKRGWGRLLAISSVLSMLWFGASSIYRFIRWIRDASRLHRMHLKGVPWFHIPEKAETSELALRFSEPVTGLIKRYPLTVVWSSAAHGKHMKSKPPVEANGRTATVKLDETRLERLRRYPGEWKGFFYMGKTPVGEAAARVG